MTQVHFNPSIILFSTGASSAALRTLAPIPGEDGGDTLDKLAVYRKATEKDKQASARALTLTTNLAFCAGFGLCEEP